MESTIKLTTPLDDAAVKNLRAGCRVSISGTVYAARDQAHKRMIEALRSGEQLPFDLEGAVVYFVGPTPASAERAIGSAGPTTSSRMDPFSPALIEAGLRGTIGKGYRESVVRDAMKKYGAIHFSAVGGAGALLSRHIRSAEVIAYEGLGTEAVRKLEFDAFPAIVAYDCYGGSVYEGIGQ